jgi:hypothetical protein
MFKEAWPLTPHAINHTLLVEALVMAMWGRFNQFRFT